MSDDCGGRCKVDPGSLRPDGVVHTRGQESIADLRPEERSEAVGHPRTRDSVVAIGGSAQSSQRFQSRRRLRGDWCAAGPHRCAFLFVYDSAPEHGGDHIAICRGAFQRGSSQISARGQTRDVDQFRYLELRNGRLAAGKRDAATAGLYGVRGGTDESAAIPRRDAIRSAGRFLRDNFVPQL